ncbi:diguanylate cyclase [Vibrio chagasii]|nr:diguanylate cyclase [Vibrio chagasii]
MVDVDFFFKSVNDGYGHQMGDIVHTVANVLVVMLQEGEFVARFGGEEFVIWYQYLL